MVVHIISEIGINHNGDLDLVKRMIFESQKCGANVVKVSKKKYRLSLLKKAIE